MSRAVDVLAVIGTAASISRSENGPADGTAAELEDARAAVAELVEAAKPSASAVEEMMLVLENYRGAADFDKRVDAWMTKYAFAGEKAIAALAKFGGAK